MLNRIEVMATYSHEVKEKCNNKRNGLTRCDFFEAVWSVIKRESRPSLLGWNMHRLMLFIRPIIEWISTEVLDRW